MLVDFWDRRKQITRGWFPAKFQAWKGQLSQAQIAAIHAEINRMIDAGKAAGKAIQTTSWMPGSDWTGTPFDPIYWTATKQSSVQAGQCFGLFVQEVFMQRPEIWTSEHFEKDGIPIAGRTYFQIDPNTGAPVNS